MWHEDRRQRLRSLLATFGRVSIDRATEEFGVSRETIRRDLLEMEADGELRRVRGGAVPMEDPAEAPYSVRRTVNLRGKRQIAAAAARFVESGQTLFLDAGSTTAIAAEQLSRLSGLTVITNSVEVAARFSEESSVRARGNATILIGGIFAPEPPATFGANAVNELQRYGADLAILSPFGLDVADGVTSFDPREAEIARAMLARADAVMILADRSKLGISGRISYGRVQDVGRVVVDAKAAAHPELDALRARGIAVTVAPRL